MRHLGRCPTTMLFPRRIQELWATRDTSKGHYHAIDDDAESASVPPRRDRHLLLSIGGIVLVMLGYLVIGLLQGSPSEILPEITEPTSRFFHLLIPANQPDVNLCRTILSASVCGYSTPTLINWGVEFNDPTLEAGGSKLAKIAGVLRFLRSLGHENDDDLVLVVDHNIMFQLRPDVILSRYRRINAEANERIRMEMGRAADRENIKQTIIFSAQKQCQPLEKDDPACYAVPQSTLPDDIYGPGTDTDADDPKNPYLKYRQRYLNSGSVIGPVGDLRRLFERAFMRVQQHPDIGSDQTIFSLILGEQEYQRDVLRVKHLSSWERLWDWFGRTARPTDPHPTHHRMEAATTGTPFEFSLGLDYAGLLGHPTVFAEDDIAWLRYNSSAGLEAATQDLQIVHPQATALPDDVARSPPPFRMGVDHANLPVNTSWSEVLLYSNLWTGVVTGIVHNAHRAGQEETWDKLWLQPYARRLLSARMLEPIGPMAAEGNVTWWSMYLEKGGAMTEKREWLTWNSLCDGKEEKLFRDDQGVWVDPR